MSTPAALEIRVHLQDGRVTRFVQNDPEVAYGILEGIHPNRLFIAAQLLIGGDHTLTAFQPHLVVRVDFITDLDPKWLVSTTALNTREITEEEFKMRCHPERDVQRLPSREIVVFGEWEMVNGVRIFLQTHMTGLEERRLPVEMSMFIQQAMTSGGLLAHGRHGGYIVLNPASLVRFTSYRGFQAMPANALPMTRLPD
jgi:hypothetical protein